MSNYFDSIPHSVVQYGLGRQFQDLRIIDTNMKIVRQYRKEVGLILGSENSQDFAISVPNSLDHYIKERLGIENYGRYMDDLWLIDPDYDHLRRACDLLLKYLPENRLCAIAGNVSRAGQFYRLTRLGLLREATDVDMFCTVFIGNSFTKEINGKMVTPRGYRDV